MEDDYLPESNGTENGDKHDDCDDDDNGATDSTGYEIIGKHSNDEHCQQQQKTIYKQNDEVYIWSNRKILISRMKARWDEIFSYIPDFSSSLY